MRTIAKGMYKNGEPVLSIATLMNNPIALDPASPISILLGVALYHRYPSIHTMNISIISPISGDTSLILSYRYIDVSVIIVSVPDSPSTPSAQLVTLIDAHTSIIVRIANTIGLSLITVPVTAISILDEL